MQELVAIAAGFLILAWAGTDISSVFQPDCAVPLTAAQTVRCDLP
jgi:hypothetical protein